MACVQNVWPLTACVITVAVVVADVIIVVPLAVSTPRVCVEFLNETMLRHRDHITRVVCIYHHHFIVLDPITLLGPGFGVRIVCFIPPLVWVPCYAKLEAMRCWKRLHNT